MLNPFSFAKRLSDTEQVKLIELTKRVDLDAGEILFREGERHQFVYWIIEGQVSLEMASEGKTKRPLVTLANGDLVAWSALLTNRRMTATVKAISPTRLIRFERDELLDLCESNHGIGYLVMRDIAGQLSQRLLAPRLQMQDLFQYPAHSSSEASR